MASNQQSQQLQTYSEKFGREVQDIARWSFGCIKQAAGYIEEQLADPEFGPKVKYSVIHTSLNIRDGFNNIRTGKFYQDWKEDFRKAVQERKERSECECEAMQQSEQGLLKRTALAIGTTAKSIYGSAERLFKKKEQEPSAVDKKEKQIDKKQE